MNWKFWQRNIENPNHPITQSCADSAMGTGPGSSPGNTLLSSPTGAWNYAAVYAAIRLLSETIAQLPLMLMREADGRKEPARDHPLFTLMHDAPSDRLTSFNWRETQMAHCLTWGNGYAMILRSNRAGVRELQLCAPGATMPYRYPDGRVVYRLSVDDKTYEVPQRDVLHIPAVGWDGLQGLSPISMHRETLGLGMAADRFGGQFFSNGVTLGGVLKHPETLGREGREALKSGWEKFKGSGYNGLVVLEEGMDYTRIAIPPEDAQFLQTRKFQVAEVARIYNIPPHMLKDLEKSSFNNIEQQGAEYLRYTISPWLVKWEQELNRKLLTKAERQSGYYFKFNASALLRATQSDRYESYTRAIQDGWMSRNEVRSLEDLNPVDGLDEYLVSLNFVDQEETGELQAEEPDDEPAEDEDLEERTFQPLIERSAQSFSAWLDDVADRAVDDADMGRRFTRKLEPMTERYITPLLLAAGKMGALTDFREWLLSQPLNDMPTADEIATELAALITMVTPDDRD